MKMPIKKMKIALVQGGLGSERDVSRLTGKGFAQALEELGHNYEVIEADEKLPETLSRAKADVALLALHGKYGEDGTVQGLCEYLKLPYTGSGVLASALCMDKIFTKQMLSHHGMVTPKYQVLNLNQTPLEKFKLELPIPVVVKPNRDGSSVGVSIVHKASDLEMAIDLARPLDYILLIEEYIAGMELTVPVVNGRALTAIEIVPKTNFYDYRNKYTAGNTDYILPPRLDKMVLDRCAELSVRAWEILRIRSYCRVDFRLGDNQEPYLIEVNTLPGCTPTSLLPKSAAYEGIGFPQLVQGLLESASLDYQGLR